MLNANTDARKKFQSKSVPIISEFIKKKPEKYGKNSTIWASDEWKALALQIIFTYPTFITIHSLEKDRAVFSVQVPDSQPPWVCMNVQWLYNANAHKSDIRKWRLHKIKWVSAIRFNFNWVVYRFLEFVGLKSVLKGAHTSRYTTPVL